MTVRVAQATIAVEDALAVALTLMTKLPADPDTMYAPLGMPKPETACPGIKTTVASAIIKVVEAYVTLPVVITKGEINQLQLLWCCWTSAR